MARRTAHTINIIVPCKLPIFSRDWLLVVQLVATRITIENLDGLNMFPYPTGYSPARGGWTFSACERGIRYRCIWTFFVFAEIFFFVRLLQTTARAARCLHLPSRSEGEPKTRRRGGAAFCKAMTSGNGATSPTRPEANAWPFHLCGFFAAIAVLAAHQATPASLVLSGAKDIGVWIATTTILKVQVYGTDVSSTASVRSSEFADLLSAL